ncbi:MAG: envelope stress response regulator transcription factor CpxR [Plesiomonas sp.]|uniref:envelope stress response regulator transcription factor CpxR n=1 Tax=Plesiomonas sp. TaxID=2486279 RepID=UPI003F3083B2
MTKLLLVDDDHELTDLLSELLEMEGFSVLIAHDGDQALHILDESIDLILLDIMMPKRNGLETLKALRLNFTTPVLMLTARGSELDRVLGLELGADDYLPKPFNDRELVARIRAILRRTIRASGSEEKGHESLIFDVITLYPGRQEVRYQDTALDLTGTEFTLLHLLIQHPGEIISRETLSLDILGKRLSPFDRSIDMHMSNLRKKLPERSDGQPWFKTLRGRGYLLVTTA